MSGTSKEQAVLGFLLHSNTKNIKKHLKDLSHYKWEGHNQDIYNLCKAYTHKTDPDYTLAEYVINELGESNYILDLLENEGIYSEQLGEQNIKKILETQQKSEIRKALKDLKDTPTQEALDKIKQLKGVVKTEPLKLEEIRRRRLQEREYERIAPSTGFERLDEIIKGFVPGHTITMTGETNVGKTLSSCNFAYKVAKQGKRVLYFALEPDTTVIEYLASIWSNKRFSETTDEDLVPPKGIDIDIYTKEHVQTLDEMVSIVENSERYDLIIIDHFGYFVSGNNRTSSESDAMKVVASTAKLNKTCILLIVHPRKPSGGRKKQRELTIHDLSGSAAFSQDATDVLILAREKDEHDPLNIKYTGKGYIAVHKTKSGGNGACPIWFVDGSAVILSEEEQGTVEAEQLTVIDEDEG